MGKRVFQRSCFFEWTCNGNPNFLTVQWLSSWKITKWKWTNSLHCLKIEKQKFISCLVRICLNCECQQLCHIPPEQICSLSNHLDCLCQTNSPKTCSKNHLKMPNQQGIIRTDNPWCEHFQRKDRFRSEDFMKKNSAPHSRYSEITNRETIFFVIITIDAWHTTDQNIRTNFDTRVCPPNTRVITRLSGDEFRWADVRLK
jgi:hypothetical protein